MFNLPDPEQVSEEVLGASEHTAPPVDLLSVCALWPDLRVVEEELDKEGYLVPLGIHGAELLLRSKDHPNRKKFTLAHELGHWVLANLRNGKVSLGRSDTRSLSFNVDHKRQTNEETWCNRFAASLLIPQKDLSNYLTNSESLVQAISDGAREFGVSEEAFLLRVIDRTPISIVQLAFDGERWKIRRRYPSKHVPSEELDKVVQDFVSGLDENLARGVRSVIVGRYLVNIQDIPPHVKVSSLLVCLAPTK